MINLNIRSYPECKCGYIPVTLGYYLGYRYSICPNCQQVSNCMDIIKTQELKGILETKEKQEKCNHSWRFVYRYQNDDHYECNICNKHKMER